MKLITLTAGCIIVMTCVTTGFADTHYVAIGGGHQTPFTNGWGSAATDIQSAIDAATAGDTVLISNGTYSVTAQIDVDKAITVRGFSGNRDDVIITGNGGNHNGLVCTANAFVADLTVTSCSNTAAWSGGGGIRIIPDGAGTTVSNCVIVNCAADYAGGGVLMGQPSSLLNCRIEGNSQTYAAGGGGGGVACDVDSIIRDCTIRGNFAIYDGGGVKAYADIQIYNSTISENGSVGNRYGGGIYTDFGGIVSNCTIANNYATNAIVGGIACWGSGMKLYNCLIAGNSTPSYAGGLLAGEATEIYNCTVAGNSGSPGGGIYVAPATVTIPCVINTIVYSNTTDDINFATTGFTNSCLPGLSGNGNIGGPPKFVDTANGNYRLQPDSPCINAGLNQDWMTGSLDLDDRPRICSGTVDMGAFEFYVPAGTVVTIR